jgi:ATP adenylyltransferase
MDRLWTPWRYTYVTRSSAPARAGVPEALSAWPGDLHCVFCNMIASADYAIEHGISRDDAEMATGIVHRGREVFLCLNAFPYSTGHVMLLPYTHLDSLAALPSSTAQELIFMTQATETALRRIYKPEGLNFGMNLGESAGAGVAGHLHLHALPRWVGDTNFMTVTSETRVLPETLDVTWRRLREAFADVGGNSFKR